MLKIAFRNIFRQKRLTILTVLTMFGGFTLASISIAWSDGSYAYVIDMFTRNEMGHTQIHRQGYVDRPSLYKTIDGYEVIGQALESVAGVVAWAPRLYSAGLASVGEKSSAARVIGIDPVHENRTTRFDKKTVRGRSFSPEPRHEAMLGAGLARVLKADVDSQIVIVSQAADGSIANDAYTIVGLLESGNTLTDQSSLYLHLADAQELFVLEGRVHEIALIGADLDDVDEMTAAVAARLNRPELEVASWKEFARQFYHAMQVDQQGSWIMLGVILMVVAVGVLNTVLMTVLERRREYGVLRAVGTRPGQVFTLVVYEVIMMAIIGIIIGFGLSYLANYLLSIYGVTMAQSFTYGGIEFRTMYSEINARSFYIPGIAVLLTAIIVSLFPATRAAHVAPARAMRTH